MSTISVGRIVFGNRERSSTQTAGEGGRPRGKTSEEIPPFRTVVGVLFLYTLSAGVTLLGPRAYAPDRRFERLAGRSKEPKRPEQPPASPPADVPDRRTDAEFRFVDGVAGADAIDHAGLAVHVQDALEVRVGEAGS